MEAGPPLRMIPLGFHFLTKSCDTVGGWISEDTRGSRPRCGMGCVNWAPRSGSRSRWFMPAGRRRGRRRTPRASGARQAEGSARPIGGIQLDELDALGVEIEQCSRGGAVEPSAYLARIHHQRLAAGLHLLHVRASMDDDPVRVHGETADFTDVVHEQ